MTDHEFDKFNKYGNGKYWENYFKKNEQFYRLIQQHMVESIAKENTKGLDIGAGPGVGAWLAADANLETMLTGYEPSDTHKDGEKLAEEMKKNNASTKYTAIKGGIQDIAGITENSLDYILILRACHEIAGSEGGKQGFYTSIKKATSLLKKGGVIIIGEPQFSQEITANPEQYANVISKVREHQNQVLGHSHDPDAYITSPELEDRLAEMGLTLERKNTLDHAPILKYMTEQGFELEKSPCLFYIETFRKGE